MQKDVFELRPRRTPVRALWAIPAVLIARRRFFAPLFLKGTGGHRQSPGLAIPGGA